jgi:asparagine synthetase B (glutamine-hydrolysing)
MYFLTADRKSLVSNRRFAPLHALDAATGVLVWSEDPFTYIEQRPGEVILEIRRPDIDAQAICRLEWDLKSGDIRLTRSWSGEFICYFSEQPSIVASHRRFAAALLNRDAPLKPVSAGAAIEGRLGWNSPFRTTPSRLPKIRHTAYADVVAQVRRLVKESVRRCARSGATLMLSGGVDSSVIAAVASSLGIRVQAATYALRKPPRAEQEQTSDRLAAARVAAYLGIPHRVFELEAPALRRNVPLAVFLAETSRGTIVDELAAHIEIARRLRHEGVSSVLTGEGADDLFGAFPLALRFYRGPKLAHFLRRELIQGFPDELAEIQNAYTPWGISLVHPYWTEELRAIGYSLPVIYRIDRDRLMKRILREAFADLLPPALIQRPKGVPRDCAQIRDVLEAAFGSSRDRYRPALRTIRARHQLWPSALPPLPKKSSACAPK